MRAVDANTNIIVAASHDIWSLGVMAFEAVVQRPTFTALDDIQACANGSTPFPWELPWEQQPPAWRASRLRALILPCLAQEPERRPTAEAVLAAVGRMGPNMH